MLVFTSSITLRLSASEHLTRDEKLKSTIDASSLKMQTERTTRNLLPDECYVAQHCPQASKHRLPHVCFCIPSQNEPINNLRTYTGSASPDY